ncbi:LytR/AlgR family response regulator transcription factor [Persicitalea jodogahamensis]|uniref:HTH LytTR-type domain-containing protein n=1 Tax=Persicitalea jodogahamensis TaxID=402147 RepID=A0A8J3G9I8_9BACT|nr:LytTR family DNA-binding domain-containing protein [Persicitalea jodogahamensis]GHB75592.1 hypothetical protein GCM10007390_31690 [Persicitalea jodogahamensis]
MQVPCLSLPKVRVGGHRRLSPQQIVRLQADRNYTFIHQANGRKILVSLTMKIIEERLRPYGFTRITRGDVINPEFIQKIWKDGCVQLTDGTRIAPSRRRKGVLTTISA